MAYLPVSINAPRVSGFALRVLATVLEHVLPGYFPAHVLLKKIGITQFRRSRYTDAPRFYPRESSDAVGFSHESERSAPYEMIYAEADSGGLPGDSHRFLSVVDYNRAYLDGLTTPEAVAEHVTAVTTSSCREEPDLAAFISYNPEEVHRAATDSARRIASGQPRSILEGVPVAIKDELDLQGHPTTVGTTFLNHHRAERDAFVVRRLREAGALILGKTNMQEIGIGVTGINPFYGTPLNPYAPERVPGGSSSGCGTLVGSGLCPIAIGADGGGSVRIPAAYCGVFGLKMTWGRVSTTGEYPLARSVGNNGPIAATARDLALAYAVTAGIDREDPSTWGSPSPSLDRFNGDLRGLRIGICTPWFEHAHEAVTAAARSLLTKLVDRGARVREIDLPGLEELRVAHLITITVEMSAAMDEPLRNNRKSFGLETRTNLALARYLSATDYIKAQQVRARMMATLNTVFRDVDVIATPTTANLPPRRPRNSGSGGVSDIRSTLETMRFAVLANMTGNPAVTMPAGFVTPTRSSEMIPAGLQCIGRHWEEPVLLRIAGIAETIVDRPRPAVFFDSPGGSNSSRSGKDDTPSL